MEVWKDIPGYEGKYQASNLGNVRSLNYRRSGKTKLLSPGLCGKGYLKVVLLKNGVPKNHSVASCVWVAFNGPVPPGMQINHINEDKTDNRLENLNLMTAKENNNWGTRIKRASKSASRVLKNRKDLSKPILQYDLEGNLVREWPSIIEVERTLGYSNAAIGACCRGRKYCHTLHGFIWKYKEVV